VFGAIVNGRPAELDGIDSMLGLFITTVPVCARIDPGAGAAAWLRALQTGQAEAREHVLAPLGAITRWSGMGGGRALFESVLVFENNAGYGAGAERYGDITIEAVTPVIRNSLPLTLRCVPGAELELHLLYDTRRFDPGLMELAGAQLCATLAALPETGDAPLSSLLERLAALETSHAERAARAYEASRHDALRSLRRDARRGGGSA
jgi:non-ribosomal peptide synthetase component F